MREYIVETKNLKKYYQMGANTVKALDGVDFRVKDQEFVAIIGKADLGKVHFCICWVDWMCQQKGKCW
mgnify:FL=1